MHTNHDQVSSKKFTCGRCNFCYVGETYRHFKTRIDEHVKKDKSKTFTNTYTLMKNVSQVLTQVLI